MRQCHKDGCTSPAEFTVDLHLTCPAPGLAARMISMRCSIEVCAKHQDDVKDYVLSDANKETICASLMDQGVPEPDFLSARFEFKPIEAPALGPVLNPPAAASEPVVVGCDRLNDDETPCTNPAKFRVMQRFRALAQRGRGDPICEVLTNMHVCAKHKRQVKPGDFLDPESRATTLAFLRERGMLLPDVDRPIIDFVELVGGEPEASRIRVPV